MISLPLLKYIGITKLKKNFYSITTDKGTDWIVSEQELLSLIAKKRTTSEKLALYADYFAGRPDVFAQQSGVMVKGIVQH